MKFEEILEIYDQLVGKCPRFERKGKTMPYTSANGYMFSMINKNGELGIRFSKEQQEKYIEEWSSSIYKNYNSVIKGYVLIPESMLGDLDQLSVYLNESYDHVMSLKPK